MKLHSILHTNWPATFRLNYHAGGWRAVMRMPIRVYGSLKLRLQGKIILPANAQRNMVIINADFEDYTAPAGRAEVCILGTWQIDGFLRIGPDSCIYVNDEALLQFGSDIYIARDSRILCYKHITLGSNVLMGGTYVTDSSHHHIYKAGTVQPMYGDVFVGNDVYLGFRTILLKGTVIPAGSVVGSGAVCASDFSKEGAEKLLICGNPAVVKAQDVTARF
ncbi:MAG: hypothetical protein J5524_08695 [Bacteroidaceae bacterium]|nr:hypothetical protein [Bacteroidaceae bacterium]MBO4841160.1 hypothetical protein [Bacteroidaceae bacterium]